MIDYDDICLGFSPLLVDTDGDGIRDAEENLYQLVEKSFPEEESRELTKVSVALEMSGNAERSVHILNAYQVDVLSANVVGLVGVPVEINVDVAFETAELVFHYDESALGDVAEENLAILWYDEEHHWYRILDEDCVVDVQKNTVSYVTTHFSTYMLVDSEAWYDAWREDIDYRDSVVGEGRHSFDIVFVVEGIRNSISKPWFEKRMMSYMVSLRDGDEAAIIRYTDSATVLCNFTDNADTLNNQIGSLYMDTVSHGVPYSGPDVNQALLQAISLFDNRAGNRQRVIVLISYGSINCVQSTLDACVAGQIRIQTVNFDVVYENKDLREIANATNGRYFYGLYEDLQEMVCGTVQGGIINQIDATDTDGDGLYDIYEIAGIQLPNGQVIYTDPANADTDGDGLSDFEETGLIYNLDERYRDKWLPYAVSYFILRSDPTRADTDDDGLRDDVDSHPWRKEHEWVAELNSRYGEAEYLRVRTTDGSLHHGGNQSWWMDKTPIRNELNYADFVADQYYRLWYMGCGVIAINDLELYLMQQNSGYHAVYPPKKAITYDVDSGVIEESTYRAYVENNYENSYQIPGEPIHYHTGLAAVNMVCGLEYFLQQNQSALRSVQWAPYSWQWNAQQRQSVLEEIESMLSRNIPVVFNHYSFNKNSHVRLYCTLNAAELRNTDKDSYYDTENHYMTIIGLYKYLDGATSEYEYILKIVSWGDIYYIRYDQYADNLSHLCNILKVS